MDHMHNTEPLRHLWPETTLNSWMDSDYDPELVSVIIPTYNRAQFITEAMDSVWDQTYRPIELIVVDDGSTDETPQVVQHWISDHNDDSQFDTLYFRQANKGAPAARNRGLIESKGEFIQYLDSDDLLHNTKLSQQARVLIEEESIDYAYSNWLTFKETLEDWGAGTVVHSVPNVRFEDHLEGLPVKTETGLYRRSVCYDIGPWNESLEAWQDWEYNARLLLIDPNVCYRQEPLAAAREHNKGRIHDRVQTREGLAAVLGVVDHVHSLALIGNNGTSLGEQTTNGFGARYFGIAAKAIEFGYLDVAEQAVKRGCSVASSTRKYVFYALDWMLSTAPSMARYAMKQILRYKRTLNSTK